MSHQILHILTHGASLHKDRGRLVFKPPQSEAKDWKSVALEDLRAIIIAAKGVHFSSNLIASLQEFGVVMLHCNEKYEPVGLTFPLPHTTQLQTLQNQCSASSELNDQIWKTLLRAKIHNQSLTMDYLTLHGSQEKTILHKDDKIAQFHQACDSESPSESLCARLYWQLYFPLIGWGHSRRDRILQNPPNIMLNYGYSVLTALCLRSIIAYGLIPQLGVFHKPRANSFPLAYDMVEPYRPIIDLLLFAFAQQYDFSLSLWQKFLSLSLSQVRVHHNQYALQLRDAIDHSASSLARAFAKKQADELWIPSLIPDEFSQQKISL